MGTEHPFIEFGRDICGDLAAASQREWLVTNGLGSYAMGTIAGMLTRGYHGLLVAALEPPLGRSLLLANLEETVRVGDQTYELFTNAWQPDIIKPNGYKLIQSFRLDGTAPTWIYELGDTLLEKRIWMEQGTNTTYIRYTLLRGNDVSLNTNVLANHRDHHTRNHDTNTQFTIGTTKHGLKIATPNAVPFYVLSSTGQAEPQHIWHENLYLSAEATRGLDPYDSDLLAGTFYFTLLTGESVTLVASTESNADLSGTRAWQRHQKYEQELLKKAQAESPAAQQLVLAADQFIVRRDKGHSVVAGYPWFGDWGRDTMIALPGLTQATGRPEIAADILRTFSHYISDGMLPNRFPDASETPEYNTADATLWYFEAIRSHYQHTRNKALLEELFPKLEDVINWHIKGTHHGIQMDPDDSLLRAGEPGTQLTWMDAKYDGNVVTPRIGKPVEINALWHNALHIMADFAATLGDGHKAKTYNETAHRVSISFDRYWNTEMSCLYDVLDGPEGNEAHIRPNQLLAISLPHSPLSYERQKAIVDVCEQLLLMPFGLRTLAQNDQQYIGHYDGNTPQRDTAYHQGTAWAWLMGPFVDAHLLVYRDKQKARSFLEPLLKEHLHRYGLGSVSEVFDGDKPFAAGGCPWQAWSVAESLRITQLLREKHPSHKHI